MSLYAGNSPGKDTARHHYYNHLRNSPNFLKQYHIVIASRECGDILYLQSLGVENSKIIACDKDRQAVINAGQLGVIAWPLTIEQTVKKAVSKFGAKNIGTINVDLCFTLMTAVPIVHEVLESAPIHAKVYLTFLRARDGIDDPEDIDGKRVAYLEHNLRGVSNGVKDWWSYHSHKSPMCMVSL